MILTRTPTWSIISTPSSFRLFAVSSRTFASTSPSLFLPSRKNVLRMSSFYDLKADLPGGEKYDFATLKGKVVLIVNTASAWYVTLSAPSGQLSDHTRKLSVVSLPNTRVRYPPLSISFQIDSPHAGLQALWNKYKEKDFVLLGFPCNQVRSSALRKFISF